ncbi:MAG TPA: efflux RND transporter permease subunit, partial [Candidatus Acidoferrum sp.]|nr:efflux RND transporter permease subunit [Candidatus Acidoferrum sp.]
VLTTSNGAPVRVKDIAVVDWGPRIRLGRMARADHRPDGVIVDEPDVIQGGVLMRKGAEEGPTLEGIHKKVEELNTRILPEGVKVVTMLDRSDLLHYTLHTVLHNLGEGMILVTIILLLFLGNVRAALIVAITIPFSLLFASIFLNLSDIPANLISLGALDFGMVVDGAVVMVENIFRHLSRAHNGSASAKTPAEIIRDACHEVQRPVLRHRHHHHRLYAHLHAPTRGRAVVPAHGLDRCLRATRRHDVFDPVGAGSIQLRV